MPMQIGCINCSKAIEYLGEDELGTERYNGFAWIDMREDDKKFFCSMKCFKTFDFKGYKKGETFGPLPRMMVIRDLVEELEDQIDIMAARTALRTETDTITFEELKAKLGIK